MNYLPGSPPTNRAQVNKAQTEETNRNKTILLFIKVGTIFVHLLGCTSMVHADIQAPPGGSTPYMGYIGMCRPIGYGF